MICRGGRKKLIFYSKGVKLKAEKYFKIYFSEELQLSGKAAYRPNNFGKAISLKSHYYGTERLAKKLGRG